MKNMLTNKKNHGKIIALEIFISATLAVFILFFATVVEYNWFAPFLATSRVIAQASNQSTIASSHFGDFVSVSSASLEERNFLPIAKVNPILLKNINEHTSPSITATGAIVVDRDTNFVLYEKDIHKRWPIASITKLVTASILLDYRDKNSLPLPPVEILEEDFREGRNFFDVGDVVSWDDLLKTMLVASSNTAAEALIRSTGMTTDEWRKEINQKLLFWGMQKTQIREVTGLSPGNISTPYEIAQIFNRSLERNEVRDALGTSKFVVSLLNKDKSIEVDTTNLFLLGIIKNDFKKDPIAKTGYIDESGFNIVSKVVGKNNEEIIVVVLGAASHYERFTEISKLAEWAFESYEWNNTN